MNEKFNSGDKVFIEATIIEEHIVKDGVAYQVDMADSFSISGISEKYILKTLPSKTEKFNQEVVEQELKNRIQKLNHKLETLETISQSLLVKISYYDQREVLRAMKRKSYFENKDLETDVLDNLINIVNLAEVYHKTKEKK